MFTLRWDWMEWFLCGFSSKIYGIDRKWVSFKAGQAIFAQAVIPFVANFLSSQSPRKANPRSSSICTLELVKLVWLSLSNTLRSSQLIDWLIKALRYHQNVRSHPKWRRNSHHLLKIYLGTVESVFYGARLDLGKGICLVK